MPTDEPPRPGKGKAYRPPPTLLQPLWERQPDETSAQWEAFRLYLDLGPKRTLGKTAKARGVKPNAEGLYFSTSVNKWAVYWRWKERAVDHDAYVARRLREATLNAQVKERSRFAALLERRKHETIESLYRQGRKLADRAEAIMDLPIVEIEVQADADGIRHIHKPIKVSLRDAAQMLAKGGEMQIAALQAASRPIEEYEPGELQAIVEAVVQPDEVTRELMAIEEVEVDQRIYRDDVVMDDIDADGDGSRDDDGSHDELTDE